MLSRAQRPVGVSILSDGTNEPLRGVALLPIVSLRNRIASAALLAFAVLAIEALGAQSVENPAQARVAHRASLDSVSGGIEVRLARIRALLDSAPAELAQSGNVVRAFGFANSGVRIAIQGLSIVLLDTSGARIALLTGDGSTVDSVSVESRRALASAAAARGRGSQDAEPDTSIAYFRTRNVRDGSVLLFVKPVPRSTARCDCLLDSDGAIVAALPASELAATVSDDGMLAGAFVPEIDGASALRRSARDAPLQDQPYFESPFAAVESPIGALVLVIACIGCAMAWRAYCPTTRSIVHRDQLRRSSFDINDIVSEIASTVSDRLGRTVKLETHFNIAPAIVNGDRKRLGQAIVLLIDAARAAMPTGGTLTLTTRFVEILEAGPERHAVASGHYVVLAIADTGASLSIARRQLLLDQTVPSTDWQVFRRVDDLSVAASIAHAHGWLISADRRPNDGNEVALYMPLAAETLTPLLELQEQLA